MQYNARLIVGMIGALGLSATLAWAQPKKDEPKKDATHSQPAPAKKEDKAPAKPADAKPADQAPPGMDPKIAAAYMAAGTPNENHKALEGMAGEWTTISKFWEDPSGPPAEGAGSAKSQMIFGGRLLHTTFKGEFGGRPFDGAGTTGYNNVSKQFESTWSDSMSTATMFSVGTSDANRKVLTLTGNFDHPVHGRMSMRQVTTLTDKDHYKMEFYNKGADGKEFKSGEILFTRKGAAKAEPAKKETPAPAQPKAPEKK